MEEAASIKRQRIEDTVLPAGVISHTTCHRDTLPRGWNSVAVTTLHIQSYLPLEGVARLGRTCQWLYGIFRYKGPGPNRCLQLDCFAETQIPGLLAYIKMHPKSFTSLTVDRGWRAVPQTNGFTVCDPGKAMLALALEPIETRLLSGIESLELRVPDNINGIAGSLWQLLAKGGPWSKLTRLSISCSSMSTAYIQWTQMPALTSFAFKGELFFLPDVLPEKWGSSQLQSVCLDIYNNPRLYEYPGQLVAKDLVQRFFRPLHFCRATLTSLEIKCAEYITTLALADLMDHLKPLSRLRHVVVERAFKIAATTEQVAELLGVFPHLETLNLAVVTGLDRLSFDWSLFASCAVARKLAPQLRLLELHLKHRPIAAAVASVLRTHFKHWRVCQ